MNGIPIDWSRYLGKWYEQLRLPAPFEDGLIKTTADYELTPASSLSSSSSTSNTKTNAIRVTNRGWDPRTRSWRTSIGQATIDLQAEGTLRVRFSPQQPPAPYIVLAVLENKRQPTKPYQAAIVGSPSRRFLWLLTRRPDFELTPQVRLRVLRLASRHGYSESVLKTLVVVQQT